MNRQDVNIEQLKARLEEWISDPHCNLAYIHLLRDCKSALEGQEENYTWCKRHLREREEKIDEMHRDREQLQSTLAQRERQCAEMREALLWVQTFKGLFTGNQNTLTSVLGKALSSDCGNNYVAKEELLPTLRQLRFLDDLGGLGLFIHAELRREIIRFESLLK